MSKSIIFTLLYCILGLLKTNLEIHLTFVSHLFHKTKGKICKMAINLLLQPSLLPLQNQRPIKHKTLLWKIIGRLNLTIVNISHLILLENYNVSRKCYLARKLDQLCTEQFGSVISLGFDSERLCASLNKKKTHVTAGRGLNYAFTSRAEKKLWLVATL